MRMMMHGGGALKEKGPDKRWQKIIKAKGQGSKAGEELTKEKARKLPLFILTQKKWRERKGV
jgi:hypothetical protein